MNNTNTKSVNPSAVKWQEGLQVIRQLLTQKMMLSTNADIAQEGAHLAHQLAEQLDWKYRIHTRCQSSKSQQEKNREASVSGTAGEGQEGVAETESSDECGPDITLGSDTESAV
jgi:hypothetical protein